MQKIKILLVDDHALVRETLASSLAREPSFEVVGTTGSAEEAMALAHEKHPDVMVMDIDMPGLSPFDCARRIASRRPDTRFLFLSAYTSDLYVEQALDAGALGYLTKGEPTETLVHAIREVAANNAYFSKEIQDRIIFDKDRPKLAQSARTRKSTLTRRETEMLQYLGRGLSKKDIATTLYLSVKTVEKHTENLMAKLDIHDRVELARYAIREGLVQP